MNIILNTPEFEFFESSIILEVYYGSHTIGLIQVIKTVKGYLGIYQEWDNPRSEFETCQEGDHQSELTKLSTIQEVESFVGRYGIKLNEEELKILTGVQHD